MRCRTQDMDSNSTVRPRASTKPTDTMRLSNRRTGCQAAWQELSVTATPSIQYVSEPATSDGHKSVLLLRIRIDKLSRRT